MTAMKERLKLVYFFRAEYDRMVGYVRWLIHDTAERDGEDIVQEVMLNLFNIADVTLPIENLAGYLYQSLRHRAVDYLRKRKPEMISLDQELIDGSDLSLYDLIFDPADDAAEGLEKKEMLHHLFAAVELLDEDERDVIFETEFEGRSFRELSKI